MKYIDRTVNEYTVIVDYIKPTINPNFGISIIISAYKTAEYIEECLNSIYTQTYFKHNDNFEVLIGVDGCSQTLSTIKQILNKYSNLRVFMMNSNQGTYVTCNTLINLVRYNNIIRFDSDDIMKSHMIESIMSEKDGYDVIRFYGQNFKIDNKEKIDESIVLPHGVAFFKKTVFDHCGGYQPWRCAADTELLMRIKNDASIKILDEVLFYIRLRPDSLSHHPDTGNNSILRKNYQKIIRKMH